MFPPFPVPSIVIQKLRTIQEGEVILIATWWPHNLGVHIYYVFVWATHSTFHTAGTYCHNRDMSQMASRTLCVLGGSHAALLPSFHIYYVFVWTTLSTFHTAGTYFHNRDMSQMASCTVCVLGGSHAALPCSRIVEEVSRLAAAHRRPSNRHWATGQGIDLLNLSKDTGPA